MWKIVEHAFADVKSVFTVSKISDRPVGNRAEVFVELEGTEAFEEDWLRCVGTVPFGKRWFLSVLLKL